MLWFHCNNDTGAIETGGMASDEVGARQQVAPIGSTLFVVPDGSISNTWTEMPDFTVLKAMLGAQIDAGAGALRARYITDVPGQAQTYERKEREARTWTDGADDADFPFLGTEASVRGITTAEVRAEVMAQVNALTPLAALIEAHRMAAKKGIEAAATLPAIVDAAAVDWDNVLGG